MDTENSPGPAPGMTIPTLIILAYFETAPLAGYDYLTPATRAPATLRNSRSRENWRLPFRGYPRRVRFPVIRDHWRTGLKVDRVRGNATFASWLFNP